MADLQLENNVRKQDMVVAEIANHGLFGIDFWQGHSAKVYFASGEDLCGGTCDSSQERLLTLTSS